MKSVELFLMFMIGDARIPDSPRWSLSLRLKMNSIDILRQKVLDQIPKASKELDEVESSGQIRYVKEYTELIVMYEALLNSVYSLFENISRVVRFLYPSKNLPQSFSDQKERFLENVELDKEYASLLQTTQWYDKINSMRDEVVHFLSGLVVLQEPTILGYINFPKSVRKDAAQKIMIDSIASHVGQTHRNVKEFLNLFSNHFLKVIDQDSHISLACVSSSDILIGSRMISLKEYLNGDGGFCKGNSNCPERDKCSAIK